MTFNIKSFDTKYGVISFDVEKYDSILARGLSRGLGSRESQICIEAAICEVLNLPHGDNPFCVSSRVRLFKIHLNDRRWSSPHARAKGLRDLGLAQLGSLGVIDEEEFTRKLLMGVIRILLPEFVRNYYPTELYLSAALKCEQEGSIHSVIGLRNLFSSGNLHIDNYFNPYCATNAICTIVNTTTCIANVVNSAFFANNHINNVALYNRNNNIINTVNPDKYLILIAKIALDILKEMKSPGCELL